MAKLYCCGSANMIPKISILLKPTLTFSCKFLSIFEKSTSFYQSFCQDFCHVYHKITLQYIKTGFWKIWYCQVKTGIKIEISKILEKTGFQKQKVREKEKEWIKAKGTFITWIMMQSCYNLHKLSPLGTAAVLATTF